MKSIGKIAVLWLVTFGSVSCCKDYTQFVNAFSGTDGNGHCHPCACTPFGAVQTGPQTGNFAWEYCGGYQWKDTTVMGFTHNRIDGTGSSELGDLLILPFTGNPDVYVSRFDKNSETARPGYYSCSLTDFGIKAELSCTPRVAIHRYSSDKPIRILVDLQSAQIGSRERMFKRVIDAYQNWSKPCHITGYTHSLAWNDREIYYDIEFNRPFSVDSVLPLRDEREKIARRILNFGESTEPLMVKTSISVRSVDGACRNIREELPGWDLDRTAKKASDMWNGYLGRIDIEAPEESKKVFYTSMYHLMMHPNNIADTGERAFYSTLSLWDTYRAAHPLFTLLAPEIVNDVVNSFMEYYKKQGFLPMWTLGGTDNYGMIGNHSIPVAVDAYLKGFKGFDADSLYAAMKRSVTENHIKYDWAAYDSCGYFPFDVIKVESVSRTLECCYDDWCISRMAESLGHIEDTAFFNKRAGYWKNVLDPERHLMRGRDSRGNWDDPFDPFLVGHWKSGGVFTEGNSWQYSWHVQHDPEGLMTAMGGREEFVQKLDSLFTMEPILHGTGPLVDVSGMIGQYAHGNEPSHHIIYLYSLAGERDKAAKLIHEVWESQYKDGPDGLSGNDDCGQMSAWYIFSTLGFYPVNPCGGEYVLGSPQLPKMTLRLPSGRKFTVVAEGISPDHILPENVTLNGKALDGQRITHEEIMNGGCLVFSMR